MQYISDRNDLELEAVKSLSMKVAQSCLTLCDPMDYSPPGFSLHGILQARILEWVAIPFSRRSSQPREKTRVSCIAGIFFTIWTTREAQDILAWVAYSFSRGSSQPRDWTWVSCIAGIFSTIWATREMGGGLQKVRELAPEPSVPMVLPCPHCWTRLDLEMAWIEWIEWRWMQRLNQPSPLHG